MTIATHKTMNGNSHLPQYKQQQFQNALIPRVQMC